MEFNHRGGLPYWLGIVFYRANVIWLELQELRCR